MQETYGIAAFRSRQQALRLETALHRAGIEAGIVTTPREVALGCGLSVRYRFEDQSSVARVVSRIRPENMIGLYRVDASGGRPKLTAMTYHSG